MIIAARTHWQMQQRTIRLSHRIGISNLKRVNISHALFFLANLSSDTKNTGFLFSFPFTTQRMNFSPMMNDHYCAAAKETDAVGSEFENTTFNRHINLPIEFKHAIFIQPSLWKCWRIKKILQIETLHSILPKSGNYAAINPVNSVKDCFCFFSSFVIFHQQGKCMWFLLLILLESIHFDSN